MPWVVLMICTPVVIYGSSLHSRPFMFSLCDFKTCSTGNFPKNPAKHPGVWRSLRGKLTVVRPAKTREVITHLTSRKWKGCITSVNDVVAIKAEILRVICHYSPFQSHTSHPRIRHITASPENRGKLTRRGVENEEERTWMSPWDSPELILSAPQVLGKHERTGSLDKRHQYVLEIKSLPKHLQYIRQLSNSANVWAIGAAVDGEGWNVGHVFAGIDIV